MTKEGKKSASTLRKGGEKNNERGKKGTCTPAATPGLRRRRSMLPEADEARKSKGWIGTAGQPSEGKEKGGGQRILLASEP